MRDLINLVEDYGAQDAYHRPVTSDPVLSGEVVKNIFHTGNRGYCINAATMRVYSFDTFEHAGHVRFKDVSPDPFLRDFQYYGSHTMAIRHHIVMVAAYQARLTIDGQAGDLLKTLPLWRPAIRDATAVLLHVCDEDGIGVRHTEFELPMQRADLARFLSTLRDH
jgi:hypothetical protein